MNDYIGKICPFCKTKFVEGDDIVTCSSCEMPHHKDCWIENQGCTTFGCMGTIQSADGGLNTVTSTEFSYYDAPPAVSHIFCGRCGAKNTTQAFFCGMCGNQLKPR